MKTFNLYFPLTFFIEVILFSTQVIQAHEFSQGSITTSVEEIIEACYRNENCEDQFANCVNYECQCKNNYVRKGKKCYGKVHAQCNDSSQCLSTRLRCENGTCSAPDEEKVGNNLCFDKSGVVVCYGPTVTTGWSNGICRLHANDFTVMGKLERTRPGHMECRPMWSSDVELSSKYDLLQPNENIKWKTRDFTLDKAVYGGSDEINRPTLLCQTEYNHMNFVGRLSVPDFDECQFLFYGTVARSKVFDVLVYDI
ncbi:hypothetical protein KQX54_020298 [Cotesia glomerata]|uniref:EB domain-containing protein n=1 Tax=Cotesia glomerata TaxID=32391 RepID=A0AAV7ISE9_COTGL|nr:hypothetical protein KQX54_020298 [Cotesia glomerata]